MIKLNGCIFRLKFRLINATVTFEKSFLKTKIKSYGDEITDFHNKLCLRHVLIIPI